MTNTRRPAEIEALTLDQKPYDTSDPQQVNDERKRVGRRERRKNEALVRLMSSEDGRLLMYDWLEACHIHGNCIGPDPHGTYFLLGERNIGNLILGQIQRVCPERYMPMMSENAAKTR